MRFRVMNPYNPSDEKPCEGAVKESYLFTENRRGVGFPDEYGWYGFGINHRTTEEGIARDLEMEDWFITIQDMAELDVFIQTVNVPITIKREPEYVGFTHTILIGEHER